VTGHDEQGSRQQTKPGWMERRLSDWPDIRQKPIAPYFPDFC
jgi:hypothetical protein